MAHVLVCAFAAMSLVLCIAAGTLWIRSYAHPVERRFTYRGEECRWCLSRGTLTVDNEIEVLLYASLLLQKRNSAEIRSQLTELEEAKALLPNDSTRELRRRADELDRQADQDLARKPHGVAPWSYSSRWFLPALALAAAIAPALYGRRILLRRRRVRAGACVICGYDLRATPDRCPECGAEVHRNSAR
jgi:hypothetical protein